MGEAQAVEFEWGIRNPNTGEVVVCERGEKYVRWYCKHVRAGAREPVYRAVGPWLAAPAQTTGRASDG